VWLLGFYVAFGLVESAARLPGRVRERRALREASDRAARDGELAAERAKSQESSGDR
jgi:chromosome condensin MukBEF MukE localization factor